MKVAVDRTTDIAACHRIRRTVFIEEQGVPEADDLDGRDDGAIHLLATYGGQAIGTARILIKGETGKIGRIAVLPGFRGKGFGVAIVEAALETLRGEPGVSRAYLSAQAGAVGFYEALGFRAYGEEYIDAGIPHRDMDRPL